MFLIEYFRTENLRTGAPFAPADDTPIVVSKDQVCPEGRSSSVQVGRYQIVGTIGAGATSKVVRAFDPMIGRHVAIKLFSPQLATDEGRERFIKEARVVGQISHQSIVALHDMGIEESTSTPYLVMEHVEGQPLDRILEKGSVPYPRACAWVADVASALHVAHRKGIIHGDVKPANVIVTEEGRVKLTDFGMARLASRDSKDTPLLGTPAYWCPEQILGKPQDARSDIFSLGVVLYEMVTGKRPFDAESLQAICQKVMSATPLPPSQINGSLPAGLNELIASCLEKDPGRRRNSAEDLALDLYPFARRRIEPQATANSNPNATGSLRNRATRFLRSA
jgi:eukaryotic-like serine/threonine-protein kinase